MPTACLLIESPSWSIQGRYPSWSIQRGLPQLVHPGGSTSVFTSGGTPAGPSRGVHFHVHFQTCGSPLPCSFLGVPCDLSHNALIYHYRMPQCIMGKIHMGCPPPKVGQTDRQTNTTENSIFLNYVCRQ